MDEVFENENGRYFSGVIFHAVTMDPLSASQISQLRTDLGWSAREFGTFFNRSRQTTYNWEQGVTRPGQCVQAVLAALRAELQKRRANCSVQKLNAWREATRKQGAAGFIDQLGTQEGAQAPALAPLVRECEAAGGQVIRDEETATSAAFVIPLSIGGLRRFVNRLYPDPTTEIPRAFLKQLRAVFAGAVDPGPPAAAAEGPETAKPRAQAASS